MNNFRDILNGLRDTFLQLPVPTRIIAGSMAVLIGIGLWLLVSGVNQETSKERLFTTGALTDDEITNVLAAFSASRLNDWEVQYNQIYVPKNARDEYYRAAESGDALPLRETTNMRRTQEQSNPFYSDSSRQSRESHAKELDLGVRIAAFPQVLRASVEHDILSRGFGTNVKQSASVVVTPNGSDPLPSTTIRMIKDLVRGHYAGLLDEDIVVTDVNSRGMAALEEENPLLAARVREEERYTAKAQKLLHGFGPLTIDATVEIDPTMDVEQAKLAYDAQPITVADESSSTNIESSKPIPSGVPGTATNALGNKSAQIDSNPAQTSKTTQKSEATVKVTGETYDTKREAPFQPKRVSYSVGVPESYYNKVYQLQYLEANPTATVDQIPPMQPDVRAKIKQDVAAQIQTALEPTLIPVAAGEDKFPLIQVWDHRDYPETPMEAPSQLGEVGSWLARSWQTIAMLALAFVALLVARSVGKLGSTSARPDFEEGFGLEIPKPPEDELLDEGDDGPRLTITGQHLKQELSQLVQNNPEAAANVLRKWLDSTAAA